MIFLCLYEWQLLGLLVHNRNPARGTHGGYGFSGTGDAQLP